MFQQAYHPMPETSGTASQQPNAENRCSPLEATRAAEILFGCYRTGASAEPEIFVAGVAAVLGDYPPQVVQVVVDPRKGLPCKTNWIPTIAEVKAACEAEMAPIRRENERRRRHEETRMMLAPPPREERPSLEVMQERYGGDQWGIARASDRKEAKPAKTLAELEAEAESLELEFSPELRAHLESKTQSA